MDKNLSWNNHVEHVLSKISKTVDLIAKLRHFVPRHTLLNIYNSLITPYLSYSLTSWGQTHKCNWNDILKLQKRALRFIYFCDKREHAIPLFSKANTLPINLLYFEHVISLMHDIKNKHAPTNIINLFKSTSDIHSYGTRSSTLENFYIQKSTLEIQRISFSRVGAKWWNELPSPIRELPKRSFKTKIHHILLEILSHENYYIETDDLSSKIKYHCNNKNK